MLFYSTHKNSAHVNFKTATIKGLAPDGGLYFPDRIPVLDKQFIKNIKQYSNEEIAYRIIEPYAGEEIKEEDLRIIVNETIHFDFPLVEIDNRISSLELFHGPTLAFKDVGARFMSRCLGHFVKNLNKEITVLVATSGDTGGAVADGFYDVPGVNVVILYPKGKVSPVQELQLTTHGKNIIACEVSGNFDDCQSMVKAAFGDDLINSKLFLTSANSINIARWLPQQFYYFFAYKQWKNKEEAPVISVPSGNFGNICAGMLAYFSGLPVKHFIASCNANDVITRYLQTGTYNPEQSIPTISNAMDVGSPSNFIRIEELFKIHNVPLHNMLSSYSFNDGKTGEAIEELYKQYQYSTDPHGAVGYLGLKKYFTEHEGSGFFLGTAHPVKFPEVVERVTGHKIELPYAVKELFTLKSEKIKMGNQFRELKELLLSK